MYLTTCTCNINEKQTAYATSFPGSIFFLSLVAYPGILGMRLTAYVDCMIVKGSQLLEKITIYSMISAGYSAELFVQHLIFFKEDGQIRHVMLTDTYKL